MILRPSTPKPRRAAWNLHFAIEGARSLNRLPSNLPRSLGDTIFHSAGAAWTVYFCSQGVNFMSHIGPGFASEFRESGR